MEPRTRAVAGTWRRRRRPQARPGLGRVRVLAAGIASPQPMRTTVPAPLWPESRPRLRAWIALSVLLHGAGLAALLWWASRAGPLPMDPIPIAWLRVEPAAGDLREGPAAPAASTPAAHAAPEAKPEKPRRRPVRETPRRAPGATEREAARPERAVASPGPSAEAAEAGRRAGDGAGAPPVSSGDGLAGDAAAGENAGSGASGAAGAAGRSGGEGTAGWMPRGGVQPPPVYPDAARRRGWEGTSHVALRLLASGLVAEVRLQRSAGHAPLDGAALAAVRRWRFEAPPPGARWNGVWFVVPIEFRLR